jgi:molybdopterin-guanine dinucleotide biosynthesis protein B
VRRLQIVGRKKSGKTSLVCRLIPLLRARGLRVGSIKHSAHPHSLDREGSDSWRHREAGAEITLGITAATVSVHLPLPGDDAALESLIERELGGLDLVLIEGWSDRRGPKIEVVPADAEGRPKPPRVREPGELLAIVHGPAVPETACPTDVPAPRRFRWNEIEALAEFVAQWTERG